MYYSSIPRDKTTVLREAGMTDAAPAGIESPMKQQLSDEQLTGEQVSEGDALVYTMRDLNQQTARIMSEVEKTGKPAFITKHGRFVAVIRPLSSKEFESRLLAEMAREIAGPGQG
jgi:prevent-host-death family protein